MNILNTPICRFVKYNKIILIALLYFFSHVPSLIAGNGIVSIQSSSIRPYEEALSGFKSICDTPVNRFVISEMKEKDIVNEIRKTSPSIILAIGMDAYEKLKGIHDIPVIYMMVPNSPSESTKGMNITGVRMNISPEVQLSTFLKAVPDMKSIGLIYTGKTDHLVERVVNACKKEGVKLIAKEISNSREAPPLIKDMEGKIDGFWMLPDVTVFTSETIEYLFLFSMEHRAPILTFSEIYLESGALISIGMDPFDMGSQAGEIAMEILSGKSVSEVQPVDARKEVVKINMKVSGKLGISIDETLFAGAKFLK